MRLVLGFYLTFGVIFLLVGFYGTGDCPIKNKDVLSDVVFVLGWPVYLYNDVVRGPLTAGEWLHLQACGNGVATIPGAALR
ncbi:MAG: hypothetical protein ACHQC9_00390 [Alphaproteobacteria bacterium]